MECLQSSKNYSPSRHDKFESMEASSLQKIKRVALLKIVEDKPKVMRIGRNIARDNDYEIFNRILNRYN